MNKSNKDTSVSNKTSDNTPIKTKPKKSSGWKSFKRRSSRWMNTKAMPAFARFANQRHMMAIRNGIVATIPFVIIGATALLILNFPVGNDGQLMLKHIMPPNLGNLIYYIYVYSLVLMGLFAAIGIGSELGKSYKINQTQSSIIAAFGFLLFIIPTHIGGSAYMPTSAMGGQAIFGAIVTGILSIEIMRFCIEKNITIKLPESVPKAISDSFAALVPVLFIGLLFGVTRYILGFDLYSFMLVILDPLAQFGMDTFFGVIIIIMLVTGFWWLGIHGTAMVEGFMRPLWTIAIDANATAYLAGEAIPFAYPEQFLQWYVWIGGSGATIGLVFAALMFGKSKQSRAMAKVTTVPALFNINEPIIFGYPVMLNPLFIIPFVAAPLVMAAFAAAAQAILSVSMVLISAWTLPGPVGAYFSSGGAWEAIIISIINMGIATLIWTPFFLAYDKRNLNQERGYLKTKTDAELTKKVASKKEDIAKVKEEGKKISVGKIENNTNLVNVINNDKIYRQKEKLFLKQNHIFINNESYRWIVGDING